ncbi:MAG: adenine phosphoribosyltransferase [Chlorobiota bacterium]
MSSKLDLKDFIRDIPDFPKEGIIFRDITTLLIDPNANKKALEELVNLTSGIEVDKVVGIESRGFFFGPQIASKLNVGFVPIRKPGKLPYDTISQEYNLEYGSNKLEIHSDAIKKGDRVIIHDDVLATGGTALTACYLVEKLGGTVVQCNFLLEIPFLKGRDLLFDYNVRSVLK